MTVIINGTAGITFPDGQTQDVGVPDPGTSGNVLTSNGTVWTSATPSPNNALSQALPLKTGTSLTAGRAVNINSSGEVGDYPVLNTLGTLVENTTTPYSSDLGWLSTDGSRALIPVNANRASSGFAYSVRGVALTGTTQTTGSVVSLSAAGGYNGTAYCRPINTTQFLIMYVTNGGTVSNANNVTSYGYARVATVDASGNVTLGTANAWTVDSSNWGLGQGHALSPLPSGRFAVYSYFVLTNSTNVFRSRTLSIADTTITSTDDTDLNWFSQYPSFLTSGNKLVGGNQDTLNRCDYNGTTTSNYAFTTLTSNARESTEARSIMLSASYGLVAYNKSNNDFVLETFSINQTTGVPTTTASNVLVIATTTAATNITFAILSSTEIVINYKIGAISYALSLELNASAEVTGKGIPLVTNSAGDVVYDIVKTGTDVARYVYNNGGNGYTRNININTYAAVAWVSVGATPTSQSTSPASVIVGGVCSGFTSLTPGVKYYVNEATFDGQITSTTGNYLVGTAVSSTQILLG
jgi:hypothetical protein